ncbi:MarR family transcriptional regulator [Nocardia sp. CDC159]|uniref:MarR family transcriptional regulator n=1 Tax=Nocardia pulmonis TaxID=2951408 RepID=A0A9X2EIF9_9NOCA|nr:MULTISPECIES: MarR family transcriptional regulator [Nocardia]MCM6778651.1 MarR family transcriptional regulator [Nocardia pulmonis]MCM6791540.1 MarR family transcriptional regulator [Nocardia sp. CDC159]
MGAETNDLSRRLRILVSDMYTVLRQLTPQHPLTNAQNRVMRALVDRGPLRVGELALIEGVRLPTMTNTVNRLEREGMVRRGVDPADARATLISVTGRGRRSFSDFIAVRERYLSERLARLDAEDRRKIAAALPALRRLFEDLAGAALEESDDDGAG